MEGQVPGRPLRRRLQAPPLSPRIVEFMERRFRTAGAMGVDFFYACRNGGLITDDHRHDAAAG